MVTPREPAPKKTGRPSKYKTDYAFAAQRLCRTGATISEVAAHFIVPRQTIWRWAQEHEEFRDALALGQEEADSRVVRSLYERAVGYDLISEKVGFYKGRTVRAEVREHVLPDVGAMIMWLKNRKPKEWRDRQEVVQHVEVPQENEVSDEQLARALALLLAKAQKRKLIEANNEPDGNSRDAGQGKRDQGADGSGNGSTPGRHGGDQ